MLIIAVIVAVSIRITKAKLDKVVSYTYYSAYSTLSDISRSMYLDIKSNRVDREYLVKNDSSRKLKYVIAYIREDLSDKFAYLAAKFKECVELPVYASVNGSNVSYNAGWIKERAYLCEYSENMLDSEVCSGVSPQYHIPDEYIVKFKAGCNTGDTVMEYDWNDRYYAIVDNSCEKFEGELSYTCCSFGYQKGSNYRPEAHYESMDYYLNCGISSTPFYESYEDFYTSAGGALPRDPAYMLNENTYYTIMNYKAGMGISDSNLTTSNSKDSLLSIIQTDFINNNTNQPSWSEYYGKTRYGITCYGMNNKYHALYLHHVKDANYGIRAVYKCSKSGYDVAADWTIDYRNTCVNGEGRIPEAAPTQGMLSCPAPYKYSGLEDFKIGDSDIVYLNMNRYTIGGTCAYAAVKCPEGTFLKFSSSSVPSRSTRYFQGCLPCEEYNSLSYLDKQKSIYNNSCGPNETEPEPETPDPDEPDPDLCDKTSEGAPCGMILDAAACEYVADPDFSRDCPEGKIWNDSVCGCVNKIATIPQDSHKFCDLFETYVNIANGTPICSGDSISDSTTDFSDKKPDLTLRNGIKLYNMSSNAPTVINDLKRTEIDESGDLSDASLEILYNQKGYLVYADIDGKNGDSKLWEDVYPFYITLSGKVIPLYDKSHPGVSGGDSKVHLEVSVARRRGGIRGISWIAKSVPFRDAACIAGYISPDTPYCNGIPVSSRCSNDNKYSCSLKVIKPVGFFF